MDRRLLIAAFSAACVLGALCLPWQCVSGSEWICGDPVEIRTEDGTVSVSDAAVAGAELAEMRACDPDSVPALVLNSPGSPYVDIPRELVDSVLDTGASVEISTPDGSLFLPEGTMGALDIRADTVSACVERTGAEGDRSFYRVTLEHGGPEVRLTVPAEVVLGLDSGTCTDVPTVLLLGGDGPDLVMENVTYSEVGGRSYVAFETDVLSDFAVFVGMPPEEIDWVHELLSLIGVLAVLGLAVPAVWWVDERLGGGE